MSISINLCYDESTGVSGLNLAPTVLSQYSSNTMPSKTSKQVLSSINMNDLLVYLYPHDLATGDSGSSLLPRGENLKLSGYWQAFGLVS